MSRKQSRMLSLCLTGALFFSAGLTLSAQESAGEKTKTGTQEEVKKLKAELEKDYRSAASRKQLEFDIAEKNADQLTEKAEQIGRIAAQAYQGGEYQKAIDHYLLALKILNKLSKKASDPLIEQKIANCRQAISNAYFYWAEKLYFDAQKSADARQYTLAIEKCEQAAKIWPPAKPKLEEAIALYRKYQKSAEYQTKVSPSTIDPGRSARQYSIDILLKQGEIFTVDKQWDKARDKYEDVLAVDPFNVKAIEAIRQLNIRMLREGQRRTNATRAEYFAETLWKEISPLAPRITGSGVSAESELPIIKEAQKNSIQNKLKSIIIPHIDFDEIELPVVLRHLRQRSKELDSEKTGVNIFLLPEENKAPAANAPQQPAQQQKKKADDEEEEEATSSGLKITLVGDNMTLGQALTYICKMNNLRMKVEKYSVVIAPPGVPLEQMETRIYPMEKDVIDRQISKAAEGKVDEAGGTQINAQNLFTNIPFDEAGAQVIYDPSISRLIVTNTADNLQKVEEMIKEMNVVDPQILIQTKFVEVQLNDLEELGFEYLFSRQNSNIDYAKKEDLVQYKTGDALPDYTINIYQPQNSQQRKLGPSADWYIYDQTYTKGKDAIPVYDTFYYKKAPVQSKSVSFNKNDTPIRTVKDMPSHESTQDILAQFTHYNKYGYKVQATMTALDQADSTDLLACPRITTMNGYETVIAMVTEAYYPSDWNEAEVGTLATGGGNGSVPMITPSIPKFDDPERLGIELRVKPQVDATDNYTITLPIQPVIRTFVGWVDYSYQLSTVSNGEPLLYTNILKMPIFDNRSIDTLIQCYDGETVVLGGVMKDQTTSFNDQYPILGNLPLVGRLFQSKSKSAERTNLLIFLTCRLINPDGSPVREREMRGLPPFRQ